jgi:hemin uptake protein HemP
VGNIIANKNDSQYHYGEPPVRTYPPITKEHKKTTHPTAGREPAAAALDSAALLQGRSEVVIRHAGREYRLRRTRLDKLILTA